MTIEQTKLEQARKIALEPLFLRPSRTAAKGQ